MVPANISTDQVAVRRILGAGFDALVEYDRYGRVVGWAGALSSQFAWVRVAQFAITGQEAGAAERATSILLGDMAIAALGLEGGGTLLAIAERQVVAQAAAEFAKALDRAVAGILGEKVAPWVVLAGAVVLLYIGFRSGGSSAAA